MWSHLFFKFTPLARNTFAGQDPLRNEELCATPSVQKFQPVPGPRCPSRNGCYWLRLEALLLFVPAECWGNSMRGSRGGAPCPLVIFHDARRPCQLTDTRRNNQSRGVSVHNHQGTCHRGHGLKESTEVRPQRARHPTESSRGREHTAALACPASEMFQHANYFLNFQKLLGIAKGVKVPCPPKHVSRLHPQRAHPASEVPCAPGQTRACL